MSETSPMGVIKNSVKKLLHWLHKLFTIIETFLGSVSRILQRATGIVLCLGGLSTTAGWLLSTLRPDPLGPSWSIGVWLVIVGSLLLILGFLALFSQHILHIGIIGQYSIVIFLLSATMMVAGAFTINLFILPWLAKLFSQFPNPGSVLQNGYAAVQGGLNSASNAGSNICNSISNLFGSSNSCSAGSPTNVVPNQQVPSLSVGDLLAKSGLPSINALSTLGLFFLSGTLLAPGCLLLGIVFLAAGVRPRSALLFVVLASFVNLGGLFFHIPLQGLLSGVLLFLSLAWLGFRLWSPSKGYNRVQSESA